MSVSMEDLIRLYNNSQSRLERASLWSHIENMIEDLAIETYPKEYEMSLYYDEDYKYKVGDRVRVKSLDWYNENKDKDGNILLIDHTNSKYNFIKTMRGLCGKVMTISSANCYYYDMVEDNGEYFWTDEMIEGLVEEKSKYGTASNPLDPKSNANCITRERVDELAIKIDKELPYGDLNVWELPEGYQFVDENGNVINATKIVLEKEHDDKLKLESTKKVREYWSEYARIFIEIYDDEPNECILTHLYTLESHRQKGYGKQALIQAEEIAKELGCHTAHLKAETNSWMHNWYLRCGYQWYKNADEGYTWLAKNL